MDPLSSLLQLSVSEKAERGLEHTPREIAQQPKTWILTFQQVAGRLKAIQEFLTRAKVNGPPNDRPTIFLVGAGTSDYIGQSLHHLLRSEWQCEIIPVASTSLLTDFSEYLLRDKNYLWISFSRSGDSPEGVAVLERALSECHRISHILVTCNASGRMNKAMEGRANCLSIVLDDSTNDRGLAMTSSFTNMLLTGQILAHSWSIAEYQSVFGNLVAGCESFLPAGAELASSLMQNDRYSKVCFVGSGALGGVALECALKVLELSAGRIPTIAQQTLGLRHGPMAALDLDTLFVGMISSEPPRQQYDLDLFREVGSKYLARTRVAIVADADSLTADADHVLAPIIQNVVPDLYRPIIDVLFGQLLGLFASIRFGLRPDVPSPNGAISRVVQNVEIH